MDRDGALLFRRDERSLTNVLHLLGLPIPEHMDGRFRPELFAEGADQGPRVEAFEDEGEGHHGISADEEKDLEEKLRGLGYL